MKCWARVPGDCAGKQSKEHYMSAGLWKGRTVRVRGFSWLNGQDREIGVGALQSRILCEHHNHQLSPLDAEAQSVFDCFEQIVQELKTNANLKPRNAYKKPKTWYIDGSKFERWAAKYLIGLVCAEEGITSVMRLGQKPYRHQAVLFEPSSTKMSSKGLPDYTS
jgi:hypothetical protein